jgi:dipeptidase E
MRLFLSGGGSESFNLDQKFIDSLDRAKPLMYIPIAMDTNKHSYEECFEWIKRYFSKFNFDNIKMVTDLSSIAERDISRFSGVYIGGGNTPFLLHEIKKTEFHKRLSSMIKRNMPIAGGSAGAIIFARTIIPSLSVDENKIGLKDFNALNRIRKYDLWAHYDSSFDEEIKEYMKKYKLKKVIALPEKCGIYVEDNKITVIGEKSAFNFDSGGKREIKNGELVI